MGDFKEIKQWRKKATPHIFALEPRMLFDGVSVIDTQTNDTKSLDLTSQDLTHIDSTSLNFEASEKPLSQLNEVGDVNLSIPALINWQNALTNSQKSFTDFVNSDQYLLTLADIFKSQDLDLNTFNERIDALKQSILSIGLNAEIELRSSIELKGYLAAYHFDQETGKDHIYVNRDWIEFGIGEEMIRRAILEEIGHAIDHRLDGAADSIGDEGEYFSRIITNDVLTLDEINRIKNENDHDQIYIDGKYIDVEFASITFTKAYEGLNASYSAIGTSYGIQTSSIYIKTPISSSAYVFQSAFPSDVTFSGNNVAGSLIFYKGGNKYTYNGLVSRPDKTGNTPKALYFAETTVLGGSTPTGKAFLLVMPGYESSYSSSNQDISTSSDPIATALNTIQTSESSNRAPIITSNGGGDSASISFAENTLISTAVTTVVSTDADTGDTKIYSIYAGADAALFNINSSTGVLTFKSSPDYENPLDADKNNIYDVRVMVADSKGATDTQTLSVNVTYVNDNLPIITSNGGGTTASISIPQLTTAVTKVIATDADIADAVTYSITGGTNSSLFSIDVSSGQLAFRNAPTYNVSGSNSYQVIVTASDGTNTDSQTITVSVTNVDSIAPTLAITSDKSLLGEGKTAIITFTFSEQVQGFTSSDITVAGGSLGVLSQDPSYPNIYRAIFTQSGASTAPSFTVASASYQDLSSNNGSAASLMLNYDVIAPTVGVDISGTDIAFGQTKVVTFTFSEDPVGTFIIGDINSTNGVISNLIQSSADPKVFTASIQSTSATGGPVVVAVGGSYTDAAGNLGTEGSDSATLSNPSIDLANTTASDTGSSSVDNITSNRKPVLEGNAPVSESTVKVTVVSGGTTLTYNSVAVSGGIWSLNLSTATPSIGTMPLAGLAEGYVNLTVGLNSDASATVATSSFLIDLTAPSVPTVVSQTANTATPTLTGTTASDTDVLKVTVNNVTYTSGDGYLTYLPGTTSWSLVIPNVNALTSSTYEVLVVSYDIASNTSTDTTSNELTVNLNTSAPILDLAPSDGSTKNNSATYTQSGSGVAFSLSGTNISDSDSTSLASLTVSYSLSSVESGDRFEIGSTIVYLSSTNATGSVFFNGTYFNYTFLVIGGVNYLQFTSRDSTNANNAIGPIASYEALIDALKFSNDASSFTNNSSRIFTVVASDGSQNSLNAQFTVTMARLNDAPTSTDDSVTTNEDTTVVLSTSDFGTYADIESSPLSKVKITALPAAGTLEYNSSGSTWDSVTLNQEITAADITSGKLRFRPATNANGTAYTTLQFSVSDGTAYSASSYTLTVNVTAVNDAPTLASVTSGSVADQTNSSVLGTTSNLYGTLSGSDTDTGTTLTYDISGSSAATYTSSTSGSSVTYNKSKAGTYGTLYLESTTGKYLYVADASLVNAIPSGTNPSESFTFSASDGTANATTSYTVNITGANDNPNQDPINTVPTAQTVNEDISLSISGISVTDSDGNLSTTQLSVLQGTLTVSLTGGATISSGTNGSSTLTLSGTETQINAALATISYQGSSNYNGADTLTILSTDSSGATDTDTVAITVSAVNDASVLVNDTKNINQNNNATGNILINDSDVDDSLSLASFTVVGDLKTYTFGQTATITGKGTITIASNGDYIFTPVTDWNGTVPTITYTTNTGSTATLVITVSIANDDENLKFLTRSRVSPPVIKPNNNEDLLINNEEENDNNKLYEDEEEISIAIKPHFTKASLVNTQLKNSSKPLKIASPEAPTKGDKANAQKQNSNDQKNDTGLKNTLTPPDALADNKGHVTYKLPEGTFTNGHGAISLNATQKDGSPLPAWIKFDASTGKIIADVPKGISAPIEIKVQATDSKGDKAETVIKIQPRTDKVSFVGKKSLSAQFKDAFVLVA